MKKALILLATLSLALTLSACSGGSTTSTPTPPAEILPTESVPPVAASDELELPASETFDKIAVGMKLDAILSQAIVTIENNSGYVFDGNVHVRFKDAKGDKCGSDIIFVEELKPGNYTYARIDISDASSGVTMKYTISESATFTEGAPGSGGVIDEETSAVILDKFVSNFGGAGNPDYATSWFHNFVKIEVFDADGEKYAVVTVKDDINDEGIDRIGNTIFGNYAKNYELGKVTLVTESGTEVFTREG